MYSRRRTGKSFRRLLFAIKKDISSRVDITIPKTWGAAFHALENMLQPVIKKEKAAIFFDEFPWIHTQKLNFLTVIDIF